MFATVTVDGYALLENQTDHSDVTITFVRTAPTSLTETATTDANGAFTTELELGVYNITYSKDGYFNEWLNDQGLYSNTTLDSDTLLTYTSLINVPTLFSTIQSAVDHAFEGDTVLIQEGEYFENISIGKSNITISSNVIISSDYSDVEGTIINGNDNGEHAIANILDAPYHGTGSITIIGLTIQNCSSSGIAFSNSSNNLIDHCIIKDNSSNNGGGLFLYYAHFQITNTVFKNNVSSTGAAINVFANGSAILTNCTIDANSGGPAITGYQSLSTAITLKNCIVSNNNNGNDAIFGFNNILIEYSNFFNNEFPDENYYGVNVTTNANGDSCDLYYNIQEDPLFVDATNDNYNLQQGSPCVDAGDPTSPYDPDGSIADMGALPSAYGTPIPIVINVPNDYTTIQAALTAANATDTVLVQPGTYTENIIWPETNGIKLISAGDSSNTIIDGGSVSSVIYMNPQTATIDTTTLIQGFTITNGGNVSKGGGILLYNVSPKLIGLSIFNNTTTFTWPNRMGGGIYMTNSNPILREVSIENNSSWQGSGLSLYSSNPTLTNVEINNNYGNSGNSEGGGIYLDGSSSPILNYVLIKGNTAENSGGIQIDGSSPTLNNILIEGNSAGSSGGGLRILYSSPNITNAIIKGNSADHEGGGISMIGSSPTFSNVLIKGNTAENGGGIFIQGNTSIPSMNDVTIVENFGSNGAGVAFFNSYDPNFNNVNIVYNNGVGIVLEGSNSTPQISNVNIIGNEIGIRAKSGTNPTILNSNILNNGYGLYNEGTLNINTATNNYWGHTSGPYHPTQNPSGQGDSTNQWVNVDPWLTAPNTDAPPIPAQNTTVTSTGNDFISLKWDTSPLGDLAGYKLYYDSDSSGYPYANSVDIGTDTSYTLSSLTLGTTYYLAVTTYDTDGNESWYSNEVTGTTRVMQAQSLDIGGDEDLQHMISHTPSITFGYYDSMNEAQTNYQVQVSTDSTFSSANMWDAGSVSSDTTSVTYAGTALVDGTTYYLRVRVASGDFWSDWSTLSFRMNTVPEISSIYDIAGLFDNALPVTSSFFGMFVDVVDSNYDAPLTIRFDLSTDSSFSNVVDTTEISHPNFDGQVELWTPSVTPVDNQQYWVRARITDGYEYSAYTHKTFLMNSANDAPSAFSLLSPADSSEVTSTTPLLDWGNSVDVDPVDTVTYTLHYGTMIPDLQMVSVDTATSYQVSTSLSDNTTYYWKVVANDLNDASTENTGGYHSFRVNTANDLPGDFALLSPENGSMVTDLTPTLHWEEPDDPDDGRSNTGMNHLLAEILSNDRTNSRSITSYYVYLDTSLTSTVPDTVTTNSYTPTVNLLEDALYYWKVEAVDNDGGTTASVSWSFWTNNSNSVPNAFTLLTPAENEETSLTPTFSWNVSSDADLYDSISYTIRYGSDPTDLMDVSTGNDLTHTPANELTDNTSYLWQVVAEDQSGATYTTALQSFTVNSANDSPAGLTIIYPANDAMVTELPLIVVWTPATDLDGDSIWYNVHLFSEIVATTTNNYAILDDLTEDAEYYLIVSASDDNGGYLETDQQIFYVNTVNTPPEPFELTSPAPNEVFTATTITFDWDVAMDPDPDDSVLYVINVESDTMSWNFEVLPMTSEETVYTPAESFPDNLIYYWSVTADDMNGGTTENTGGPRMFVINTENDPPTASTLVAPLNGSIQTDLTPNFYWTEAVDPDPMDHVSYTMNWWGTGDMGIQSIDTDSNGVTPETILMDNSVWEWMVIANDMQDSQSTSDTSYFYSDAFPEPPLNFATVAPENNVEGLATEVEFVWEETDDPDPVEEISYRVVYATNWEDSSTYVYSETIEDTSMVITLGDNSQYYWLVEALDSDGFIVGSNENTPNVIVVGTLAIDGDLIPVEFALRQNYPNPFNPVTTLRYDLPENGHVNITIYDMLGREVKTLVNQTQDAGYRSVIWDATNDYGKPVSAGIYLYQIQAGEYISTKKMVLLK